MASTHQIITMTLMLNQGNINAIKLYAVSINFVKETKCKL